MAERRVEVTTEVERPRRQGLRNALRYGTAAVAWPAFFYTTPQIIDKIPTQVQDGFVFGFAIAGVVSIFRTLYDFEERPNEAQGTRIVRMCINTGSDVIAPYLAVSTVALNALARLGV